MKHCGIPKLWRRIVENFSYKPRLAVFTANGPFAQLGQQTTVDHRRCVVIRQGVLMGDPMTKPVLHLVNIVVREAAAMLHVYAATGRSTTEVAGPRFVLDNCTASEYDFEYLQAQLRVLEKIDPGWIRRYQQDN